VPRKMDGGRAAFPPSNRNWLLEVVPAEHACGYKPVLSCMEPARAIQWGRALLCKVPQTSRRTTLDWNTKREAVRILAICCRSGTVSMRMIGWLEMSHARMFAGLYVFRYYLGLLKQ
jgi:hypothetical protein